MMMNMAHTQNVTKLTNAFSNEHYLKALPPRRSFAMSDDDTTEYGVGLAELDPMVFPTRMDSRDKHVMLKTDGLCVQFVNSNQQQEQQQLRTTTPSSSSSSSSFTRQSQMNSIPSSTANTSVWDESFVTTPNALYDHAPARGYCIRANESIPPGCGIFYFEVTILRDSPKQPQQQRLTDMDEGTIHDEMNNQNSMVDNDNNSNNDNGNSKSNSEGLNGSIFVGLITANISLNFVPGTTSERFSYCYESKHGMIFSNTHSSSTPSTVTNTSGTNGSSSGTNNQEMSNGRPYSSPFSVNDTVGCCINFLNQTIHFTKNGVHAGVAFQKIPKVLNLYPCVALTDSSQLVQVNFGSHPFQYDLQRVMVREGKNLVKSWIEEEVKLERDLFSLNKSREHHTKLSKVAKGGGVHSVDAILKQLVLSHLVHQGYTETATIFARDSQTITDDHSPTNVLNPNTMAIDEDDRESVLDRSVINQMKYRQQINRCIVESGDVDTVLASLLKEYPNIYRDRFDIIFALKCHKFLEMYHQLSLKRLQDVSLYNLVQYGHQELIPMLERELRRAHFDNNSNDMVTSSDEEDEEGDLTECGHAYDLQYSQYREQLDILFSLLAYTNPTVDSAPKHLATLLNLKEQREELAKSLNQALLDYYSSFNYDSPTSKNQAKQFTVPLMERVVSQSETCLITLAETNARHAGYSFISYKDFV